MPNEIVINNDSILETIKKQLGITYDYDVFDQDIIIHINTVLNNLIQMGVGPQDGYMITDARNTWNEFIADSKKLQQVKSYVYLKVKLLFDPPQSSALLEAYNKTAYELEYRLYTECGGY